VITVDEKGFPVLLAEKIDLATFAPTKSGQGNDFHDSFTGKFTYAPPGVQIMGGEELIKGLSTTTRKVLFDRAKAVRANQLNAAIIDGKLHIVLLKNGRKMDAFAVLPKGQREEAKRNAEGEQEGGVEIDLTDSNIRDTLIDAARTLGLQGEGLKKFLEDRLGGEIDPRLFESFEIAVRDFRLNDLVDYLHMNVLPEDSATNELRVSAPRGYLRKTFAGLTPEEVQIVFTRLGGRGWSEESLQTKVAGSLPAKLKKAIHVPDKESDEKKSRRE
jgi:hypothetical protein